MPCRWAHHLQEVVVVGGRGRTCQQKQGTLRDASGRGFDPTSIRSSQVFSFTRGLFLFLDQGPVPTLSHQSPCSRPFSVHRRQTPTSFCRPATCDAAHLVSRRRATTDQSFSQLGLPRVAKAIAHSRAGSPSPAGRVTASPSHQHPSQWCRTIREGGRPTKDVISTCPPAPALWLACERRDHKAYQVLKLSSTCCLLALSLTP